MSDAAGDDLSFAEKVRSLLVEQEPETRARGIVFHSDFDPGLVFPARSASGNASADADASGHAGGQSEGDPREAALRALIRFVIATVPDGCEVYYALARPAAPVALVGEGVLTLRWQVAGDRRGGPDGGVVTLRPRLGDAQAQIIGKPAQALRARFRAAGWPLSLGAIQGGEEIWVRAEVC